jgi:hypothetical protein
MKKKILLYRANFGSYDEINKLKDYKNKNYDEIIVTDRYINNKKKTVLFSNFKAKNYLKKLNCQFNKKFSNQDLNRIIKIYPFAIFPNYDIYIYLDCNLVIKSSIDNLINRKEDWVGLSHPFLSDLKQEAGACYIHNKIDFREFLYFCSRKSNLNQFSKHMTNSFIIRKNNRKVRQVSKIWLKKYLNGPSRDQLHLVNIPEIKKLNIFCADWSYNSKFSPIIKFSHPVTNFKKFKNRFIKLIRLLKLKFYLKLNT